MGKTVESYRMAIEDEIRRWKGFEKALRTEDREAFEAVMDACRSYASAGSNATQPILFEPMVISILVSLQKKITRLEKKLGCKSSNPRQIRGWLLDVYPSDFGKVAVWVISENGERIKLTDKFQPCIYVSAKQDDLERLI